MQLYTLFQYALAFVRAAITHEIIFVFYSDELLRCPSKLQSAVTDYGPQSCNLPSSLDAGGWHLARGT